MLTVCFQSCNKEIGIPSVSTDDVSDITEVSAICGGIVVDDGGAPVTSRGVCRIQTDKPTITDNHTSDGSGIGGFKSIITGLTANQTYYVRAYAINEKRISYGNVKTFATSSQQSGLGVEDFLGTYSFRGYDCDKQEWDTWSGVEIVRSNGDEAYYVVNASDESPAEAWLGMNSDGTLSLGPSDKPDKNGRYANGFTFDYYSTSDGSYTGRFNIYTEVTLTKTPKSAATSSAIRMKRGERLSLRLPERKLINLDPKKTANTCHTGLAAP